MVRHRRRSQVSLALARVAGRRGGLGVVVHLGQDRGYRRGPSSRHYLLAVHDRRGSHDRVHPHADRAQTMKHGPIWLYVACGLLGLVIPNTAFFYAASRVSAGVLAITIAIVPSP